MTSTTTSRSRQMDAILETMFCTAAEIEHLTGSPQPAAQERILREWGLTVTRNRLNRVILTRDALVRWQLGERPEKAKKEPVLRIAK